MRYFAIIESDSKKTISAACMTEDSAINVADDQILVETASEQNEQILSWIKRYRKDEQDLIYDPVASVFTLAAWPQTPASIDKTIALANQIDTVTISGLLNPTDVTIAGLGVYKVTDGSLTLTFDLAGTYAAYCQARNHIVTIFKVVVT